MLLMKTCHGDEDIDQDDDDDDDDAARKDEKATPASRKMMI